MFGYGGTSMQEAMARQGVAADCWILTGPRQAGADVAVVNASGIGDVAADVGGGGTVGPIF